MARIVVVAPSQPSRTPRLVRNANALASAGHDVTVVTPVIEPAFVDFDREIVRTSGWRYVPVPLLDANLQLPFVVRARRKLMSTLLAWRAIPTIGSSALMYGAGDVARVVSQLEADLYLGQQQATFPLVARAARFNNKLYACDVEDILTESDTEQGPLLLSIERAFLPTAAVVSTMSEVAADYLDKKHALLRKVIPLHNCASASERAAVRIPSATLPNNPSIYWFGQTLGPHSLAVELIRANALAGNRFRIVLRGKPAQGYLAQIQEAARLAGSDKIVEVLPVVEPSQMVFEASKHDILFGSQPSEQLFHQLAIGNKVFTGVFGGCALLLTDTVAHRKLEESLEGACRLVSTNIEDISRVLRDLIENPGEIVNMRFNSWNFGTHRWSWETESSRWTAAINFALSTAP